MTMTMMLRSTRPLLLQGSRRLCQQVLVVPAPQRRQLLTSSKKTRKNRQRRLESTYTGSTDADASTTAANTILQEAVAYDLSLFRRVGAWYNAKLTSHPLTTKAITGGIIAGAGDLVCQVGARDTTASSSSWWTWLSQDWDVQRTARFGLIGTAFVAPVCHYWYAYLHRFHAGTSAMMISKRVVLDQLVCTPPFMVVWLASLWTLEGSVPPKELPSAVTKAMPDVMTACWALWVPMQYLNFYAVPLRYQVLFTNVVELAWNAYLSFVATGGGGHGHHHAHDTHGVEQKMEEVVCASTTTAATTTDGETEQSPLFSR